MRFIIFRIQDDDDDDLIPVNLHSNSFSSWSANSSPQDQRWKVSCSTQVKTHDENSFWCQSADIHQENSLTTVQSKKQKKYRRVYRYSVPVQDVVMTTVVAALWHQFRFLKTFWLDTKPRTCMFNIRAPVLNSHLWIPLTLATLFLLVKILKYPWTTAGRLSKWLIEQINFQSATRPSWLVSHVNKVSQQNTGTTKHLKLQRSITARFLGCWHHNEKMAET